MKKFLSLFCVLALLAAFAVIPASAVEAAQTIVDVDPGDEISYQLVLSDVDEKVVGCDFSVYYDENALDVTSVADFTNSTNEDDWRALINPDLDGEVIGNWSILRGVDFSGGGNLVTVNFKAKESGSTHISYYVRYLYPDSLEEFTKYTFTCNVTKNGTTVLENAKPELGANTNSDPGQFVNSIDGDSANAGQGAMPNAPEGNDAEPNENGGTSSAPGTSSSAPAGSTAATTATAVNSPNSKAAGVETIVSTDAEGNEVITVVSATPSESKGGGSPALWIVLGIIVVAGACVAIYFVMKKKKPAPDGAAPETADKPDAAGSEDKE